MLTLEKTETDTEHEEYLRLCEEYREERLLMEDWRKYDNGIVLASRLGNRFLETEENKCRFMFFEPGKYKG